MRKKKLIKDTPQSLDTYDAAGFRGEYLAFADKENPKYSHISTGDTRSTFARVRTRSNEVPVCVKN